jgi:hypothetical protein
VVQTGIELESAKRTDLAAGPHSSGQIIRLGSPVWRRIAQKLISAGRAVLESRRVGVEWRAMALESSRVDENQRAVAVDWSCLSEKQSVVTLEWFRENGKRPAGIVEW